MFKSLFDKIATNPLLIWQHLKLDIWVFPVALAQKQTLFSDCEKIHTLLKRC